MRQRAPNSTQITGVIVTALAVVGVGYGVMNGIGTTLFDALEGKMTVATLPPDRVEETVEPPKFGEPDEIGLDAAGPLAGPDEVFKFDDDVISGTIETASTTGSGALVFTPPPIKVGKPRLLAMDKPPYPARELRAQHQGISGLELCISDKGLVTSAAVISSAGYPLLDEAALKWVRDARFSAGTLDGQPQAMCGHRVAYEWRIEGSR
jgi:TonB family protein